MKFCECGCGKTTNKITHTWTKKGLKKGEYRKFIVGHHKGHLGTPHSEETKKKIKNKNIGRRHTQEERIKIGIGNKGKTVSEEVRKKIGLKNKGRKMSDEAKNKLRLNHKGICNSPTTQFKRGNIPWNKGIIYVGKDRERFKEMTYSHTLKGRVSN